jgi:hypothetical protein
MFDVRKLVSRLVPNLWAIGLMSPRILPREPEESPLRLVSP